MEYSNESNYFITRFSEFKKISAKPFLHIFVLCLLAVLGIIGNIFKLPIMFGVDILFGNVAIVIAIMIYGPILGALVAVFATLPTLFFWGHPYFILTCVTEALFIGYLMRRIWSGALLASILFWLIPGGLFIWFSYQIAMEMPMQGTVLIWLKQSVNGIFDVLLANCIIGIYRIISERKNSKASMSFDRAIFNIVVAMVFVPALLVLIFTSRTKMLEIQRDVISNVTTLSNNLNLFLDTWTKTRLNVVRQLAVSAQEDGAVKYTPKLQRDVEIMRAAFSGFQSIYIADENGKTVAFDPLVTSDGKSTLNLDFSDRNYFSTIKKTLKPYVTDLFIGRGSTTEPILGFDVPILKNGKFAGVVAGASTSQMLQNGLKRYATDSDISITVVDSQGHIIASTIQRLVPLDYESSFWNGEFTTLPNNIYLRRPIRAGLTPSAMRWKKSVYGTKRQTMIPNWFLITEASLAPYMDNLEVFYIENFALILALCLSGLSFSFLVSKLVTRPIHELATVTSNLPERVEGVMAIQWPETRIKEINSLVGNFKTMTAELNTRFNELNLEISEHALAQEKLQEATRVAESANKAKSTFLANMSHEIRTPLSAVLGYSDLLAEKDISEKDRKNAVDAIARNGDQLQSLIDDILDFSKVEAGQLKLERKKTSLDEIISGGIEVLKERALEKNLQFNLYSESDLPDFIETDATRLRQILLNLVGNAVKFTETGSVNISLRFQKLDIENRGRIYFKVVDTGIGLSEQDKEKLFKPFGQIDASTTRRFGGTGLGLVLSRRLARTMGGDVALIQCGVGRGCTFESSVEVGIPLQTHFYKSLDEARHSARGVVHFPKTLTSLKNLNLLLVEDSKDVRFLVTSVLRKLEANVEEAESGLEGVRKALERRFDVILMDVQMPEMDGIEAVQVLRRENYFGPIIALTAHALQEHRDRCLAAGFNAYLTKPVNFFELSSLISEMSK